MGQRQLEQKQMGKNKLYSLQVSGVECIAKGKAHKKCEFGYKVSVAIMSKDNFTVGAQALHGNPCDGHTLNEWVELVEKLVDFERRKKFMLTEATEGKLNCN
jgi:IS5 family transposase